MPGGGDQATRQKKSFLKCLTCYTGSPLKSFLGQPPAKKRRDSEMAFIACLNEFDPNDEVECSTVIVAGSGLCLYCDDMNNLKGVSK
jgi:hypothetical protein